MKHYGDITKLNGADLPIVDCITGGSPCQDLSVAGKRAGLAGERSGLFMEQIRIVKEMREHDRNTGRSDWFIRPRYMVWENVPGAFSSNGGKDFQAVLTEIARITSKEAPDVPLPERGGWPKSGCLMGFGDDGIPFSIAWRLHDAQFWGVPQRRKRIALVADFRGTTAPEILFERGRVYRNSPESQGKKEGASAATNGDVSATSRCQGNSNDGRRGRGDSVNQFDGDSKPCSCVYGISSFESNAMQSSNPKSGIYEADTARTLDLNGGNPACNQGGMIVLEGNGSRPSHKGDGFAESETMYTLNATERHAVYDTYQSVTGTIDCGIAKGTGNQLATNDMFVTSGNIVRRLTPLECERLQGFPDGWTNIGNWKDTKGKRRKTTDGARYKALGNSIATPFWFYLLRRISAQYERPATLGSLFDGIGGFPYCWEKCNGKGTAIWASEIEEFPIAVTKKRFPEGEEING